MRRRFVASMVLILTMLPAVLQSYEVPKELTINRPEKNPPVAEWVGPVQFPHGKHAVWNACGSCHHEESDDKNLGAFLRCSQCHNKPGVEDKNSFYLAWHHTSRYSCQGCHRQVRLDGRGMPPLSCTDGCHKKS